MLPIIEGMNKRLSEHALEFPPHRFIIEKLFSFSIINWKVHRIKTRRINWKKMMQNLNQLNIPFTIQTSKYKSINVWNGDITLLFISKYVIINTNDNR